MKNLITIPCLILSILVTSITPQENDCVMHIPFNATLKRVMPLLPETYDEIEKECQKLDPEYTLLQYKDSFNESDFEGFCDMHLIPLGNSNPRENITTRHSLNTSSGMSQIIQLGENFICAICEKSMSMNLSSPTYPNPTMNDNYSTYHLAIKSNEPYSYPKISSDLIKDHSSLIKDIAKSLRIPEDSIERLYSITNKLNIEETHFQIAIPSNYSLTKSVEMDSKNTIEQNSNNSYTIIDIRNIDFCQEGYTIDLLGTRIRWPETARGHVVVVPLNISNILIRRECKYDSSSPDDTRASWTIPSLWTIQSCKTHSKRKIPTWALIFYTICLILSMLGLIGIAITAISFKKWRSELSNRILLNLSFSLAIPYLLGFSQEYFLLSRTTCITIGVIYHYFLLTMHFWTLVMSGLQLVRILTVLGAKGIPHLLIKVSLFAWGMPIIPLVILVSWDADRFYPLWEIQGFCYPKGIEYYITVRAPMIIITAVNLLIFILITCRINYCFGWGRMDDLQRHGISGYTATLRNSKQILLLFFIFGIPWTMFQDEQVTNRHVVVYFGLFFISITGFVLFVYFVLLDPLAMSLWKNVFLKLKYKISSIQL